MPVVQPKNRLGAAFPFAVPSNTETWSLAASTVQISMNGVALAGPLSPLSPVPPMVCTT